MEANPALAGQLGMCLISLLFFFQAGEDWAVAPVQVKEFVEQLIVDLPIGGVRLVGVRNLYPLGKFSLSVKACLGSSHTPLHALAHIGRSKKNRRQTGIRVCTSKVTPVLGIGDQPLWDLWLLPDELFI